MNTYSQNKEDLFVLDYFGNYKGSLLSIGENDGVTFSNSKLLIEQGWSAVLLEPGLTCISLYKLHSGNRLVNIYNFGVGEKEERVTFWESGAHIKNGKDKGLVSTVNFEETKRWPDVEFTERSIGVIPFSFLTDHAPFDFISLDTEGNDWIILKQIDLDEIDCKCLCIEWNGNAELRSLYTDYCATFGLKLAKFNAENLIFVR